MNIAASQFEDANSADHEIYAKPGKSVSLEDCLFYHTMDVPGYGTILGPCDLRKGVRDYLGRVDFEGKRVLEIGTTDGFFCYYMESKGADVVAYDLSENHPWDIVPYARFSQSEYDRIVISRKDSIRRLSSAFWLCHHAFNSKAKMVYGTAYAVPQTIGPVDISTFGAILLHVRDPFFALQNALRLTKEIVIITEPYLKENFPLDFLANFQAPLQPAVPDAVAENTDLDHARSQTAFLHGGWIRRFSGLFALRRPRKRSTPKVQSVPASSIDLITRARGPFMVFLPDFLTGDPWDTWWYLSLDIVKRFIGVLGFEQVEVFYHHQEFVGGRQVPFYTVVGHRTKDAQIVL